MVYKFELTVVNSSHSYPMHIWGCAWIYRWPKKLLKIRTVGCCWNDVGLVAITGWLPLGCWPQALELQAWASQSSQDKLKTMLVQNVMGQTRCGTMWKWKIMQRWDRSKHISIIHCISGIVELHSVKFPAFFWFTSVWKPGSLVN